MQKSRSVKRWTENTNVILKAEKESKKKKKKQEQKKKKKKKSVSENYLTNDKIHFVSVLVAVCLDAYVNLTFIDYFPIAHNTLCLPPKFCITYCLKMLLGKCNTPRSI